jgi:NAD(P)-dependent dehydrogenase (short-subunit alcohol dehydrogenase family)
MTLSYVVTGGARGIGRAIVERLARDAHVVAVDYDPPRWHGRTTTNESAR